VLKHYITQARRTFWRFRVTALVNLFGLSLALVCFVATYLFLDSVLQTGDREFKNASRTYVLTQELWTTPTNRMIPAFPQVGAPTAKYLRADLPALEAVARAANLGSVAAATDDRSVYLAAAAVDPDFLKIFDLKPLEGDLREALSSAHSAIITASAAMRLFGTKRVVGRPMLLQNRSEVTISAVIDALPAGSHMGEAAVIIDRALAAQLGWSSSEQAVDQTIYMASPWDPNDTGYPVHVIGVAENGYPRLVGPNADSNMYVVSSLGASVPYIRIAREDIPAALAHIDTVWKTLVPKVPMRRSFSDELFNISYEDYAAMSGVVTGLSACAFVIAIMGLIGMAIHITSRRLHEIGIRKTLGATAGSVVLMLLRDFSKPVLIANLIAWPFAFFLGRLYYSMLTHHADISPWPFVLSLAITVAIAWLAVGAQALRAASVKPALVLHAE
jgi:MacB-like periplasmic core domain